MKKFSPKVIQDIREQWRRAYAAPLTEREADEIASNVTDFFDLLVNWTTQCAALKNNKRDEDQEVNHATQAQ